MFIEQLNPHKATGAYTRKCRLGFLEDKVPRYWKKEADRGEEESGERRDGGMAGDTPFTK